MIFVLRSISFQKDKLNDMTDTIKRFSQLSLNKPQLKNMEDVIKQIPQKEHYYKKTIKLMQLQGQQQQLPLSKNTRILFNLLEIRIFDLSQALQVTGHTLSVNQVKQTLEKQYNVFGQVEKIFDEMKIKKLYDIMKQISQNYMAIAAILIEDRARSGKQAKRAQENKQDSKNTETRKEQNSKNLPVALSQRKKSFIKVQPSQQSIQQAVAKLKKQKSLAVKNKLGGVCLYNQNYYRGIENMQKKFQALQLKKRKHYNEKQLIKELIYKEISEQTEVQKLHENDEISKFIKQGKIKHELYNHIEYQKDLQSISSFLKQSQDDALKFLTDSKKPKQEDNEEEIIINYHELIQILTQKKKTQYKLVEQKIKEIVESFRVKILMVQQEMQKKDQKIQELEYKLKRKEGKEYAVQTIGFRSKFNFGEAREQSIEEIEEQHKAIVQLLKRNLEENQKQMLMLETDVKGGEEKLKKRDAQIANLTVQIQRLKKSLKEEKEKHMNTTRNKQDQTNRNSVDKPLDLGLDKADLQSVYGNEVIEDQSQLSKPLKKRKQKYSMFGHHSSSISTTSKLFKPREDSILSSGFAEQQSRRLNSFAVMTGNHFYRTQNEGHDEGKSEEKGKYENFRTEENEDMTTSRKDVMVSEMKRKWEEEKERMKKVEEQKKDREQGKLSNAEEGKQVQNAKIQVTTDDKKLKQIAKPQLGQQHPIKSFKLQHPIAQSPAMQIPPMTPFSQQSDQMLSTLNLLQKNAQTIYELIFESISTIDSKPLIIDEQIKSLKEFLSKYNQRQLHSRLKRMHSLVRGLSDVECEQIVEKELSEEEDSVEHCSHRVEAQEDQAQNSKTAIDQLNNVKAFQQNHVFRKKEIRTQADKYQQHPQKPEQLSRFKPQQRLITKKNALSKQFFKKLHNQIRISGKGFNLTKKEFLQICQNIEITQREQKSSRRNSSCEVSQEQDNNTYYNIASSSKNKDPIAKPTQFSRVKQQINRESLQEQSRQLDDKQRSKELKIQGMGIQLNDIERNEKENRNEKEKENILVSHKRNQSQSMKTLPSKEQVTRAKQFSVAKDTSHKTDKQSFQTQTLKVNEAQQSPNKTYIPLQRSQKPQLQQFYKILKSQGARIESLQKLEQLISNSHITIDDVVRISQLLTSGSERLFERECSHRHDKSQEKKGRCEAKECCEHVRKYEIFLEKMQLNEQSLKRNKKDLFAMHVLNIDGRESQKDFYKKKLSKQKSSKYISDSKHINDLTTLNRPTQKQSQVQSFHIASKKSQQKNTNEILAIKKQTVSVYTESKTRNLTQAIENQRRSFKNYQSGSFLPQLINKPTQLIRN